MSGTKGFSYYFWVKANSQFVKDFRLRFINHRDEFLVQVIELGDLNSSTLGHFPKGAYYQMAKKNWILIAHDDEELLGYLLFRVVRKNNSISITHLCINEKFRSSGVAKTLLDHLVKTYRNKFLAITLKCRDDYAIANSFWNKYGFRSVATIRSRSKAENYLNTWRFELDAVGLFGKEEIDGEVINALLDLNIIIDLRDKNESEYKLQALMSDWFRDEVEYYFASETYYELLRDSYIERRKKTQQFIKQFKEVGALDDNNFELITNNISLILGDHSVNDRSDIKQLATAIQNRMDFFITRDAGLLDRSLEIYKRFQIEVVKPTEFILNLDSLINSSKYQPARLAGANYDICRIKSNEIDKIISDFLRIDKQERKSDFKVKVNSILSNTQTGFGYVVIDREGIFQGISGYSVDANSVVVDFVRTTKTPLSTTLFIQMINSIIQFAVSNGHPQIIINDNYLSSIEINVLREFRFEKNENCWIKLNLKGISKIEELADKLVDFAHYEFVIRLKTLSNLKLDQNELLEIERKLFPIKIESYEIPSFIIPIKPYWASQLFDHISASEQLFGSNASISWSRENVYYRSGQPRIVTAPARILWYLSDDHTSGRRQSIVACSYIDDVDLDEAKIMYNKYKRFGVYQWAEIFDLAGKDIKKEIMGIRFSDTELFTEPIKYKDVKKLLLHWTGKAYTFQSPVRITQKIFLELYRIGFNIPSYEKESPSAIN